MTDYPRISVTKPLRIGFYLGFVLLISLTCLLSSCSQDTEAPARPTTETATVEETISDAFEPSLNYIFNDEVGAEEQQAIIKEAEQAISQIHQMLGMELAEPFDCIFDSHYKNREGEHRSYADYREKTVHCIRYTDFVHEYIHMLLYLCPDRVYQPDAFFSEGTATYFSLAWSEQYGSRYQYLYNDGFARLSSQDEDKTICSLLAKTGLPINERYYFKAFVALVTETVGFDQYQRLQEEFLHYRVGAVTVEYLVTDCGGIDIFLSAYFDSIRISDIYGESLDALIVDALLWNRRQFAAWS